MSNEIVILMIICFGWMALLCLINLPSGWYFGYSGEDFEVFFAPLGRHVAMAGWNLAWRSQPKIDTYRLVLPPWVHWRGGAFDSRNWKFWEFWNINALHILNKISGFVECHDQSTINIWDDSVNVSGVVFACCGGGGRVKTLDAFVISL